VKVTGGFAGVEDVMVRGGIGADLVVRSLCASKGTASWVKAASGKMGASIVTWKGFDLDAGEEATLTICVETGKNKVGYQEYTQAGIHFLDGGFSATYTYLGIPYQTFKTQRLPIEAV
jgi:hypothetical protein